MAGTVGSIKDVVSGGASTVKDGTPDGRQVSQGARDAVGVAQQNPLGLAVSAVAAGFLVGMLLPSSRVEDARVGATADEAIGGPLSNPAEEPATYVFGNSPGGRWHGRAGVLPRCVWHPDGARHSARSRLAASDRGPRPCGIASAR